jgi:hypothetical protein
MNASDAGGETTTGVGAGAAPAGSTAIMNEELKQAAMGGSTNALHLESNSFCASVSKLMARGKVPFAIERCKEVHR